MIIAPKVDLLNVKGGREEQSKITSSFNSTEPLSRSTVYAEYSVRCYFCPC